MYLHLHLHQYQYPLTDKISITWTYSEPHHNGEAPGVEIDKVIFSNDGSEMDVTDHLNYLFVGKHDEVWMELENKILMSIL